MAALDRGVERVADFLSRLIRNLPIIGSIAYLLHGQHQPEETPARTRSDEIIGFVVDQAEEVQYGLLEDWRRFRNSLFWLGIGTIIAAILALLVGLIFESRMVKMWLEIVIASAVALGYLVVYVVNYRGFIKSCTAAGLAVSAKKIMSHLKLIDAVVADLGVSTNNTELLKNLQAAMDGSFATLGVALTKGLTTFRDVAIVTFQKPMRIVTWFSAGALYLVLVNLHHEPLLWGIGVLGLLILLPGILAWNKEQRTKEQIPRRLLRIAGWILIFPIVGVAFIPEVANWIFQIQYVYMGPAAEALHDKLLWHNTIHLWMAVTLVLVYSFLEFSVFPTVDDGGVKTKVRGAAGVLTGLVLVSFFALGALLQAHGAFANAYEGGSWRTRGYLVGLVVALIFLVVKAFHGKWKQALAVVAVLFVGSCLYSRSSGHRGLWGAQFDYDAFARAQAKIQAKTDIAPVEPAPKSLMLPSWGPPAGWTPDGKRSAAASPTPHGSASVAQASVLPVPTVPVRDDTLRQVLSPGMTPWRFKLPPGVYQIRYTGRMLYTTARPVYEYRNGQQVLVYPMVDSTGGKIPVRRRFRPQDYPMPDGMEGDPYIRFFDNPREYHRLSGTRWDPITIPKEVVAEIGQNVDLDWPIWEGNGSLCVTLVKVY